MEPGELLTRLEHALQSSNVPVVNLTNVLQLDAEKFAASRTYNYIREDTHWNDRGISIAAAEIARSILSIRDTCHLN